MTDYDAADDSAKSTNTCEECGDGYWVKPYRRAKSRFCSFECAGRHRARVTLNVGPKDYMRGNSHRKGLKPTNAFTSEAVSGNRNARWREGLSLVCEHCGNGFKQKPWVARQNGAARFCSRECFAASGCFDGNKSPCFVGGVATYRGRDWPRIRGRVVSAQDGRCADCGGYVGASLPVHHIHPFRLFASAEEANDTINLVGLCQPCHMKRENTFKPDLFVAPPEKAVQEPLFPEQAAE